MRELYACQLDLETVAGAVDPKTLVLGWVARGSGATIELLQDDQSGDLLTDLGHQLDIEQVATDVGLSGWTCSWRRPDDNDPSLMWRLLLALGPLPGAPGILRFSLRIGLERAEDAFRLTPARYDFASPAIVRTLLREHRMLDGGIRVEPLFRERRAGEIAGLVDFLLNAERQLPVLVLTRHPTAGPIVDAGELARQLAGLAHVEVLSTHLAAIALSDAIGKSMSVWGGAARLYWPDFRVEDDPRRHRLWIATRLIAQDDFVLRLRGWLGGLAAAAVPEHPAVAAGRAARRDLLSKSEELPQWVRDYVDESDAALDDRKSEIKELREALAVAIQAEQDARDDLADVRRQFRIVQAATQPDADQVDEVDLDTLTVAEAFRLARTEAGDHVVYLDDVEDSVRAFSSYQSPRRLYEALSAINDAGAAWQSGTLGSGFGAFFADHGYGYTQRDPAATARPTKARYQRSYHGGTVAMDNHLKVDESSSPDQCLRVYWYLDKQQKALVIGHVGRHLPV